MAHPRDPTEPIRKKAITFPAIVEGTSCNQSSFKTGRGSFLFVGPGAKGQGYKAMFKLKRSIPQARELAAKEPERFQVGTAGWVTTRFSTEEPLPKPIWEKWLKESYDLCCATSRASSKKSNAKNSASKKQTASRERARSAKK